MKVRSILVAKLSGTQFHKPGGRVIKWDLLGDIR